MRLLAPAAAFLIILTGSLSQPSPDKAWVDLISATLIAETASAQMAHRNAGSQLVPAYGDSVLSTGIIAQQVLGDLARAEGLSLSDTLTQAQDAIDRSLVHLAEARFDSAFLICQIAVQKQMILLLQQELQTGADPLVRAYAGNHLPFVRLQLSKATELNELRLPIKPDGATSTEIR